MEDKKPLRRNVQRVETIDHVNGDTGEIVASDVRIQSFQQEIEPPYVKLYTQDIARLYGLTESTQHVLMCLARHMIYRTNKILIYGPVKDAMMAEMKMNKNTLNKAIDTLYKQGILIRESRACYVLDPELFGSGSWADVKKVRLSIDYHPDGSKSIKTQLLKGNEVVALEKKGWKRKTGDAVHEQLSLNFDQVPGVFGEDSYSSSTAAVNSINGSLPFPKDGLVNQSDYPTEDPPGDPMNEDDWIEIDEFINQPNKQS